MKKYSLFAEATSDLPIDVALSGGYEKIAIQMLASAFLLILLVGACFWVYRKFSTGKLFDANPIKSIKVIEKRALSPKTALYLIEVNGKQVLIAESQLEVKALADTTLPPLKKALSPYLPQEAVLPEV